MAQATTEAIQLSNTGCERFAAGDLTGALNAYRAALYMVQAHHEVVVMGPPNLPADASDESTSLGISAMESSCVSANYDEPFVYERALVFRHVLPETQDGAATFCGVVVFNMALIFDLRSKMANNSPSKYKALQLYEAATDLFSKTSPRVDFDSIIAVVCNNKARIYFELSYFKDCEHELQRLRQYLALTEDSRNKNDFVAKDDVEGMLLNLLLIWPPVSAHAA